MDNPETHATLCTKRRTKTNKATKQHRKLNKEENGPFFPFLIRHSIYLNRNKVKKKNTIVTLSCISLKYFLISFEQ